jgi:hypothetical protein
MSPRSPQPGTASLLLPRLTAHARAVCCGASLGEDKGKGFGHDGAEP